VSNSGVLIAFYRVHPLKRASSSCVYSQCAVHSAVGPCAKRHFIHTGSMDPELFFFFFFFFFFFLLIAILYYKNYHNKVNSSHETRLLHPHESPHILSPWIYLWDCTRLLHHAPSQGCPRCIYYIL
jgi:hypothetical protein